jgi:regulator of nonsense transcripts 1
MYASSGNLKFRINSEASTVSLLLTPNLLTTMDAFDNFQFDSSSSYGGLSVVDDTSSVYTSNSTSQSRTPIESLENLSLSDLASDQGAPLQTGYIGSGHDHHHRAGGPGSEEDFDNVLDDLKDESQVELPPHACRCARAVYPNF